MLDKHHIFKKGLWICRRRGCCWWDCAWWRTRRGDLPMKCSSRNIQNATMAAVAAAASVPSSFTSTKALWATAERKRPPWLLMPVRSAFGPWNTEVIPIPINMSAKELSISSLNFGKWTMISVWVSILFLLVHSCSLSRVSSLSSCQTHMHMNLRI